MAPHRLSEKFDRVQTGLNGLAAPILRLIVVGVSPHRERRSVEVRCFQKSFHFQMTLLYSINSPPHNDRIVLRNAFNSGHFSAASDSLCFSRILTASRCLL